MLTITVLKTAAPQTVTSLDGVTVVQPGESLTAAFSAEQEAYIRDCPGHFSIEGAKAAPEPPRAPETASPVQHRSRRRGRR